MITVTWQDSEYKFDDSFEVVTHEEWVQIKEKLKLTIRGVVEGLEQLDIDAITAVYWLTMRSDGQHDGLVLKRDMGINLLRFMEAVTEGKDDSEPEPEPDPTVAGSLPDTTTPDLTGSSTETCAGSPPGTSSRSPASAGSASGKSAA